MCLFRFTIYMFFGVSLDHFIPVLLAFVVLGLISSVPSQKIGGEELFRSDLFCVEWDVLLVFSVSRVMIISKISRCLFQIDDFNVISVIHHCHQ